MARESAGAVYDLRGSVGQKTRADGATRASVCARIFVSSSGTTAPTLGGSAAAVNCARWRTLSTETIAQRLAAKVESGHRNRLTPNCVEWPQTAVRRPWT